MKALVFLSCLLNLTFGAGFELGEVSQKPLNITAITMFLLFVLRPCLSLIILIKNPNLRADFTQLGVISLVCKMVWLSRVIL